MSSPTSTTPLPPVEPEPKKLDLSFTQLVGGALAAMTAAALGSRIGLAGTVIGAAVASVIAGVGGALYTASLRRTRDTVRTVWRGRGVTATSAPATTDPRRYPGVAAAVAPAQPTLAVPATQERTPTRTRTRRRWWPRVLVGAVASFGIAAGALTTIEIVTGHALSGGTGTTIQQVQRGADQSRTVTPAEAEPTTTPESSTEPVPSATPTPSTSAEPQPTESTSPAPTTSTPEPSSSTEPSPAASELRTEGATS